jgi:hypothetical protein
VQESAWISSPFAPVHHSADALIRLSYRTKQRIFVDVNGKYYDVDEKLAVALIGVRNEFVVCSCLRLRSIFVSTLPLDLPTHLLHTDNGFVRLENVICTCLQKAAKPFLMYL